MVFDKKASTADSDNDRPQRGLVPIGTKLLCARPHNFRSSRKKSKKCMGPQKSSGPLSSLSIVKAYNQCKPARAWKAPASSTIDDIELLYRPTTASCPKTIPVRLIRSINMAAQGLNSLYKYAVPAAIGVSLASNAMYDVRGGTRAVIFDRLSGVKETVVNEGTHFLIPWLQKPIIFDVRTKPRTIGTTTGSKDLQMVSLTLRVLHRPEVQALPKIYQVWNGL